MRANRLERRRREEAAPLAFKHDGLAVGDGFELCEIGGIVRDGGSRGQVVHRLRGLHDRSVAGAAAQVAGENVVDATRSRLRLAEVGRIQRHHEARRAEAALRAMRIDQRLLHRMQPAVGSLQMLDGRDAAALEHRQQENAGVDGAMTHLSVAQLADRHRAGAAIAFGAPFLGARQTFRLAQIVEEGRGGRNVPQRLEPAIEDERNAVAHDR